MDKPLPTARYPKRSYEGMINPFGECPPHWLEPPVKGQNMKDMSYPNPRNIPLLRSVHGEPYPLSEQSRRCAEKLLARIRALREKLALSIAEAAHAEALAWQMAQKDRYHEDQKVRSLVAHMNTIIGDYQRRLREDLAGACRQTVDLETTLRLGFDGFWMTSDPERMRRISDEAIQLEVEEELKKANFEEARRAGAHVGEE